MLVIMTDNQLIAPQKVCCNCLMADRHGQPRWHQGVLRCGHQVASLDQAQPTQFECEMGFRVADIS
ncbi:hypothetical protein [Nodosilinea sp. E11]|uniref:hypothetical protein n=1 Tax=Nodosilinea sp. E11 TaxID=3037479 RepID=UPI002934C636|nr:hypothetical protein [Nodosilinea sp. E11]WOD38123.1 hypothetical protein RRF56_18080 [Nodosilinea sp. E11]